MKAETKWTNLGWRHPLWNIIRIYTPLYGRHVIKKWETDLREHKIIRFNADQSLNISTKEMDLFFVYIEERERLFSVAFNNLRSEEEALYYCNKSSFKVGQTTTKSQDHYQSSKPMVAAVSAIAEEVCTSKDTEVNSNPQARCVWHHKEGLHATVRNLDGAIQSLINPYIIWEIKEYWGKTSGGSKMSDALYECSLVGLELREYEERTNQQFIHIAFLDGKKQWESRKSDIKRFIDIMNQGLIDYLIIGKEVETDWRKILEQIL